MILTKEEALYMVKGEYEWVSIHFPPFNSPHEGYAVILEEVRELEREVFKHPSERDIKHMRAEARQIATMAVRFMVDICGEK